MPKGQDDLFAPFPARVQIVYTDISFPGRHLEEPQQSKGETCPETNFELFTEWEVWLSAERVG